MTAVSARPRPALSGQLPPIITSGRAARLTELVRPASGAPVEVIAPYTGTPLGRLPQCTDADVDAAFTRARAAQRTWAAVPVAEKAAIFLRLHDLVLQRQSEVLDLVQAENGKARRDAFLEVADVANTARYYARTAPKLLRPQRRTGMLPLLTVTHELRHPKGVVTVISPWNYPLALAAGDTIPALLAGNAVVQKPDNQTAHTALWVLALAREAGLPADVWQIVLGRGSDIGDTLIDGGDYLMFTGSTASGKTVAARAAARLISSSMELGGKNPMLVLDDAELGRAVDGAVRACFSSSGQLCISIERMYVQDGVYDAFVARFTAAVKAMKLGAGFDYGIAMGSLTTPAQVEAVEAHVADAVAHGASVLTGGRRRPDLGPLFFEATVLADVPPSAQCYRDETFGPLVALYRFTDVDEAIERANASEYGLNASVWTRDARRAQKIAARLRAGTVNVNEAFAAAWGSVDAPMGGMGASGLGRRHGAEGLLKYTEAQTIARQRLSNIGPPRGVSEAGFARALTFGLSALKRVGWR